MEKKNMEDGIPKVPTIDFFYQAFLSWPLQTIIGIILFFGIWIIGGNLLSFYSLRRRGLPYSTSFTSTLNVFSGFNKKEWYILLILAISASGSFFWGVNGQV